MGIWSLLYINRKVKVTIYNVCQQLNILSKTHFTIHTQVGNFSVV